MQNKLRLIRHSSTLAWVLWIGAWPLVAAGADGILNVKDFGAKGDGGADDTKALQAAFDAQRQPPYKKVYFPPGSYRITDTVRMYAPNLCTEGASISQASPEKDLFYIEFAWRGRVSNFAFYGGKKQLNMRNIRVDQGLLCIDHCSFNNSADFAIYMEDRSNPMHLMIEDCHFNGCAQVLYTVCDWTTLTGGWITTAWMDNKAAIEHRGAKLLLENVVGVPLVTGKDDRWIDNYGGLTCRNFRFGGEFGGMTPVWNFRRESAVLLEDCYIGAQGSGKKAAVYCEEVPCHLVIRDCASTVPPVMLSQKIKLSSYFDHIAEGLLVFEVGASSVDNGDLQKILKAVQNRDKSPIKPAGQISPKRTKQMLEQNARLIRALPVERNAPAKVEGHAQKTNPTEYIELTRDAKWDLDDFMDATNTKNSEYIAMRQVGDDTVFMRRAPDGPSGAWPHALVRNVMIDLDKTPWISWKQKDPGPDPLPPGVAVRAKDQKLDVGIDMPMGFALRVIDNETRRMVLLFETHTPPWFNYGAKDLRKQFDVKGGRRTFTIKYYPLGVYITGQPGSGTALPGDYQILDFIRAESE